jgi:hypothetical protein
MATLSIVVPQGIDAPEGYVLNTANPVELGADLYKWEQAAQAAALTASYVLSVTALSVHKARATGVAQPAIIEGFGLLGPKGKAMSKQDVSRLDILGLAVSHGVTDTMSVRAAINYAINKRSKAMDVVRAIIRAWAADEKRTDSGLIKSLRAGEDKSLQEMFEAALKSAANNAGKATEMEGITITEDALAYITALMESARVLHEAV